MYEKKEEVENDPYPFQLFTVYLKHWWEEKLEFWKKKVLELFESKNL